MSTVQLGALLENEAIFLGDRFFDLHSKLAHRGLTLAQRTSFTPSDLDTSFSVYTYKDDQDFLYTFSFEQATMELEGISVTCRDNESLTLCRNPLSVIAGKGVIALDGVISPQTTPLSVYPYIPGMAHMLLDDQVKAGVPFLSKTDSLDTYVTLSLRKAYDLFLVTFLQAKEGYVSGDTLSVFTEPPVNQIVS